MMHPLAALRFDLLGALFKIVDDHGVTGGRSAERLSCSR
jgi:hypothetical protein